MELVDLPIDMAVGLKNLQEGLPFTQNLLEIGTVHN
jgi:hypothetical protein